MSKVTVVGAGNVGATCANILTVNQTASEVVLLDIKEGLAEGKAMDIMQTQPTLGFATKVTGITNDYSQTANSDVVVITSGIARKPGMTREDLISVNAGIVKSVALEAIKYSPKTILLIVSNPTDTLTYLTYKSVGLPKNRVFGLSGALDSSRFVYFLSQALKVNASDIEAMVIGGHNDTMIPLKRLANYKGIPVSTLMTADALDKAAAEAVTGGATLTKFLGTSAWMAPASSACFMVKSVLNDEKRLMPCTTYLEGEYGQKDIFMGVPVVLGKNGVEKIVDLNLNAEEKALYEQSAVAVRAMNQVLFDMKLI